MLTHSVTIEMTTSQYLSHLGVKNYSGLTSAQIDQLEVQRMSLPAGVEYGLFTDFQLDLLCAAKLLASGDLGSRAETLMPVLLLAREHGCDVPETMCSLAVARVSGNDKAWVTA